MTEQEIMALGPAFAAELKGYRRFFGQARTARHFDTYCRGLLSDLPRKTVEPIALAAGTAVRTLQEFLVTAHWDHDAARDHLQRRLAAVAAESSDDDLGTVGLLDETSFLKKGDKTPGVQRQYLGCVGKLDNGIVTVHIGLVRGEFRALLDAELYLPRSWADDRARCQAAGIPDAMRYRAKWRIAVDQLLRLQGNGVRLDWLVFDEGYGSKPTFLWFLNQIRQKFVAEVPVNFSVRTTADQYWRAKKVRVWAARGWQVLVTAVNERTGEVKFFVSNAVGVALETLLRVAFRRAAVEHAFRVAKTEAGLGHYEGRDYTGLIRHLVLSLVVLGFVAVHTERLRGKKSRGDAGTGVPGLERPLRRAAAASPRHRTYSARQQGDHLPSAAKRPGRHIA